MRSLIALLMILGFVGHGFAEDKPNILFIAIDDLRPELGCYGSDIAVTPHLDALAGDGLLFNRAYCQQAICSPSRASLMTGARPDTIGVVENYTYFRDLNPDIVTLPEHFRANGYETVNCGKVYHGKYNDSERSWSRLPARDKMPDGIPKPIGVGGYALPENQELVAEKKKRFGANAHSALVKGPAYEAADVPDQRFEDGYNTDLAIATMKEMVDQGKGPFFMGLGYKKPHLNFVAPRRYWDLYNPDDLPAGTISDAPSGGAAMGLHASFELRTRHGIPKSGPLSPELSRTLLHGYLACVSYVDAQIGRVIKSLDEAGLRDSTIIMVWGDHGWHLGDMGVWGKATNYEIATRVPLIVWTPDMMEDERGKSTDALVELVDMYPTLCDLAGISQPNHLEGHSFAPLLDHPEKPWKSAVFSQYPNPALREWAANPITPDMRELFFGPLIEEVEAAIIKQQGRRWDRTLFEERLMGYAMRTDRYRLVVWKDVADPDAKPLFLELYDHVADPDESENLAASQPELVQSLLAQYRRGWQGSLPRDSTEQFDVFLPLGKSKQLKRLHISAGIEGVWAASNEDLELGFSPTGIAFHAAENKLVVTGAGRDQTPASVIHLGDDGQMQTKQTTTLPDPGGYTSIDRSGKFFLTANYPSGKVSVYRFKESGEIGEKTCSVETPKPEAHCVLPTRDNRFAYIPCVKNNNALFQYAFDQDSGVLSKLTPFDASPPAMFGPRHVAYHPEQPIAYFSNEQQLGVSVYRIHDSGQLSDIQHAVTTARRSPYVQGQRDLHASDLVITPDGEWLFVAVRDFAGDRDSVYTFRMGDDGRLSQVARTSVGDIPWKLSLSPTGRRLMVSETGDESLSVYEIKRGGGLAKVATFELGASVRDFVVVDTAD